MHTLSLRPARVLTITALAAATVALTGCSGGGSAKSMPRTVTASAQPESRDITTAVKGQTFTVRLPTNSGSTYAWRLAPASANDKYVSLQDRKEQQDPDSDMSGASADDVFTFRAYRTGQTTLTFIYDRPWVETPARTFTLDVDVYKNAKALAQANAASSMEQ